MNLALVQAGVGSALSVRGPSIAHSTDATPLSVRFRPLPESTRYWELMCPWGVSRGDQADVAFVALKLLEYHRAPAVAEWISH